MEVRVTPRGRVFRRYNGDGYFQMFGGLQTGIRDSHHVSGRSSS